MSASSDLLKNAVPAGKSKTSTGKNTSASAALLKAAAIPAGSLKYVPAKPAPVEEKKVSLPSKIAKGVGEFGKALASPVATLAARPFQAAAELSGVSDEKVNEVSKKYSAGLIAPTPQNNQDVKKDIGRAVETVALGIPGGTLAKTAIGGAAFGLGASLEQGNDVLSKETAVNTAIGTATGALLHGAFKGVSKLLGKKAPTAIETTIPKAEDVVAPVTPEVKIPTAAEKHSSYAESQGYEPYPTEVPTINAGSTIKKSPVKQNGYTYIPVRDTAPNYTSIPEGPIKSTSDAVRLPKVPKGDTVAKAANDVEAKIVYEGFDALPAEEKARFTSVTRAEQVDEISKLINTDGEAAQRMALGQERVPNKIDPQILFNTIAKKAENEGNIDVLRGLAKSPIASQRSLLAQKLGAAGVNKSERSVVDIIAQNDRHIEEQILKKTGKTVEELHTQTMKEVAPKLDAKIKLDKGKLSEFVKSIRC